MTGDQNSGAAPRAQAGEAKSVFRFLDLPPEIRIMIYQLIMCPGSLMTFLSPPPIRLLRTNMQVRDEALAVYYAKNIFHLTLEVPAGQVLHKLQKFVDGKQSFIAMNVRQIIFTIDQKCGRGHGDRNDDGILGYLPFRFPSTDGEERNSASRWTDRLSAKKEFIARARVLGNGPMFAQALELFDAVWMLADTFPAARKWIFTTNDLPLRFTYTAWEQNP